MESLHRNERRARKHVHRGIPMNKAEIEAQQRDLQAKITAVISNTESIRR